jgi:alpha-beta hydrolase superfamily lysophospholipase
MLLVLPLLLAPLSIYSFRWFEFAVTFHPEPFSASQGWRRPAGAEEVSFRNDDQQLLHGWFVSSPSQPAAATVIFFHGNGGNIGNVAGLGESLAARGFDVLLFDYRGYGKSEGRIRDERDLYSDADAAYIQIYRE